MKKYSLLTIEATQKKVENLKSLVGPYAFLSEGKGFPRCEMCEKRLTPLFQIDISNVLELFAPGTKSGYLQFLACFNGGCDEYDTANDVTVDNYLVRIKEKKDDLVLVKGKEDFPVFEIIVGNVETATTEEDVTDDMIGGYPLWIHDESHGHCPDCKNDLQMVYRMQIGIPDIGDLPYSDAGAIYISQCKIHIDRLRMVWLAS